MTYLTTDDLAERWHTTSKAILNMRHKLPPAVRIGRRLLWDLSDIEDFEAGRRETPMAESAPTSKFSKPSAWPARTRDYSDWGKTG